MFSPFVWRIFKKDHALTSKWPLLLIPLPCRGYIVFTYQKIYMHTTHASTTIYIVVVINTHHYREKVVEKISAPLAIY